MRLSTLERATRYGPHNGGRCAEPAVAPGRGGITVFQGSSSHQPPQQVNGVVRPGLEPAGFGGLFPGLWNLVREHLQ